MTEDDARVITLQLLKAADSMHSRGFIHRDIKPLNILLKRKSKSLIVSLADFGFAIRIELSKQYSNSGTPGYMAPEVVVSNEQSGKADVFSIGCVVFYMITGRHLFKGENAKQTLLKNGLCSTKTMFKRYSKLMSPKLRDFLKHILTIDPSLRYTAHDCFNHPWIKR